MSKQSLQKLLALLFGFALVAAACGGSSGETEAGSDEESTESEEEESTDEESGGDDGETGGAASDEDVEEAIDNADEGGDESSGARTFEEWEALWAEERAAIVETLSADEYGLGDDGILRGPAGFELDTNNCPADWSNTGGIEDGTIKIGQTIAQSGALALYGNFVDGITGYFEYVNDNGGIGPEGLQVEYIAKDDEYVATRTQELVDELLQTEDPFFITTLGSPNTFSVYNTLNELCVPQPMVLTGHQAWGDPEGHPWTTGMQLSYSTEALLWVNWIEDNVEGPVTVAGLVMDNDFGLAYEQAFADFAAESDAIEKFVPVRHDPAAATLTNEVTTAAAENPDVFISMTAGAPCVLAIQEAERSGITESADALFTPSVCKGISATMEPAGSAADGWYVVGGGVKDSTDPQWADDSYVSWVNATLDEYGYDSSVSVAGQGFGERAWAMTQAMLIAAELPGGLNRTNLMLAIRNMDMTHPMLLDGIGFNMSGNDDAYLIEGSEIAQFDAGALTWNQQGGIIELSGLSPNCPWVSGEGC